MALKTATLTTAGTDYASLSGGLNSDAVNVVGNPLANCNQVTYVVSGTHTGVQVKLWLKTAGGTWVNVGVIDLAAQTNIPAGAITIASNGTLIGQARFPLGTFIDAKISLEAIGTGTPTVEMDSGVAKLEDCFQLPISIATTPQTITSANANALAVGPNGTTNPTLQVDGSTASAATGLKVKSAAAAAGLALSVISSGTNENLTIDAKGSGTITIGNTSTGNVVLGGGGGLVVAKGTLTGGGLLTCGIQVATSGPIIYSGSGSPTISAAVKGSLYMRTDGSSTSTRAYVATDTAGGWAAITTAS